MFDQGAVFVVVVLTALQPVGPGSDGAVARRLSAPTVTATQMLSLSACEALAEFWRDNLEDRPLPGRTVRIFCVTP